MRQLDHYEILTKMPHAQHEIILFVCGLASENLGMIMRSADVFSVKQIYYYGEYIPAKKRAYKVSRGSSVPVIQTSDTKILTNLAEEGYKLISLEITDTAKPLRTYVFPEKCCLIVGNESQGVPQELLDISEDSCYIEMSGSCIPCMNVAVSVSIALNKYNEQMHI